MLRDRLAAVRGTDGRVCGKRHFLRFVAFYVMLMPARTEIMWFRVGLQAVIAGGSWRIPRVQKCAKRA
jgi:hypothetical protein